MLDFTSALYLGLEHASWGLPAWNQLTLGKPAVLETPPGTVELERNLAALIGCERALLAPSTLHLFWDLITILAARGVNLFVESGSYPIARWGAERAEATGATVRMFRRHSMQSLRAAIKRAEKRPAVVVADGYCPGCGRPSPVAEYLECTRDRDGLVVLDDTQALGIFGHSISDQAPYGRGGGGSLQRAGIRDPRVVIGSSLAKAFGTPVAVLAASKAVIAEFEQKSATRMHCSPASVAALAAAARALALNRRCGDALRWNLAQRVARFRQGLEEFNLAGSASAFPVQPLRLPKGIEANTVHQALLDCGIRAVLHNSSDGAAARISFVVTSRHTFDEVDYAVSCLVNVVKAAIETLKGGKGHGKSTKFTGAALPGIYGTQQ